MRGTEGQPVGPLRQVHFTRCRRWADPRSVAFSPGLSMPRFRHSVEGRGARDLPEGGGASRSEARAVFSWDEDVGSTVILACPWPPTHRRLVTVSPSRGRRWPLVSSAWLVASNEAMPLCRRPACRSLPTWRRPRPDSRDIPRRQAALPLCMWRSAAPSRRWSRPRRTPGSRFARARIGASGWPDPASRAAPSAADAARSAGAMPGQGHGTRQFAYGGHENRKNPAVAACAAVFSVRQLAAPPSPGE